jgi:hypothetical protein
MSTTIDLGRTARRAARFIGAATLVMALWFSGLAAVVLVGEPTRGVIVLAPSEAAFRAALDSSALLVGGGNGYVIALGQHDGFVRELYAAGAWLVLPALRGGCGTRTAGPRGAGV